MKQHTCYTYFCVVGDIPEEVFLEALGLARGQIRARRGGIELGRCRTYSVDLNEMYRETLALLLGKESILADLRERYSLTYYLAAVPELYSGSEEPMPILSLAPDIVEFLYLTGTEQDLDYSIF